MRSNRGQTALALVFVIGGIIVLFGTTLAFLAFSFMNSTYGFQAANRASALARGGVDDAMLQLLRDKNFSNTGYCIPYSSLPCPSDSVYVVVTQDMPIVGQATVTSEATVSSYRRKLEAIFSVNASTSLIKLNSSQQISL
jgi:uncharacterized protein (UPF0333 family)